MKNNAKNNLKRRKLYSSNTKFLIWFFFTGGSFGLGYSITKNILFSKILTNPSIPGDLNQLFDNEKFKEPKEITSKLNHEKKYFESKDQTILDPELKQIIDIPLDDDSFSKITIKYSQRESSNKQAIFKSSINFFKKESFDSLKKTLYNTNKTKSSKVEAD